MDTHSADRYRFAQEWLSDLAKGASVTHILLPQLQLECRCFERPLSGRKRYGWLWAASSRPHLKVSFAPWLLLPSGTWRALVSGALFGEKRRCIPFRKFHARHASKGFARRELGVIAERFPV